MSPQIRRALMIVANKFECPYNEVENRFNDLLAIREPRVAERTGKTYALTLQDLYNEWASKTNRQTVDVDFGKTGEGR